MPSNNNNPAPPGQVPAVADNMRFYEQLRSVPDEAKKAITDGRLKGKTDINTMWRRKRLTEIFGPCGFGWRLEITKMWLETADQNTVAAFVDVNLYIRDPRTKEWSEPIPGTGGNVFKRRENSGNIFVDDDCFKKALSDAIGTAAMSLGLAADVYFAQDTGKYTSVTGMTYPSPQQTQRGRQAAPQQMQPAYQQPQPTFQQVQPAPQGIAKEELRPGSRNWLPCIVTAANYTESIPQIRARIDKVYTITDQNFLELMKLAGKVSKDATALPAAS